MNFLLQAFSEANGNASSTRVLCGAVVAAWLVVFLKAGWVANGFPPVSVEQLGVLGVAFGAKVWQKAREAGKTGNTEFLAKPPG